MLAMPGSLTSALTPPFASNGFALTAAASNAPTGISAAGTSVGSAGLVKLTLPDTLYLMSERHDAPMRLSLFKLIRTPTFQLHEESSPVTLVNVLRLPVCAMIAPAVAAVICPAAAAVCAACAIPAE